MSVDAPKPAAEKAPKAKKKAKKLETKVDYKVLLRVWRAFGRHYRAHAAELGVAYLGLALTVGVALLLPWPLKLILDHVILRAPLPESARVLETFARGSAIGLLATLVGLFIVLRLLDSVFTYLHRVGMQSVGEKMTRDIRNRLFARLQRLSLGFHGGMRTGDLVHRLTADVSDLKILMVEVPETFVFRLLTIVSHVGLMLWLDWRLALVAFAVIPILYLANRKISKGVKEASTEKRTKEGDMASLIWENVNAMALVLAHGREQAQQERFARDNRKSLESGLEAMRLSKVFKRTSDLLIAAGTCGVVWLGGLRAMDGDILPGTLVLFAAYLKSLYSPIDKFAAMLLDIAGAQVAAERLLEVQESAQMTRDEPGAQPVSRLRGRVTFENVGFSYRAGDEVLAGLSFTVEPGQTVALVGRNGAGKSTLIRLLLRLHDPTVGRVRFDDLDARAITVESLRANFTVVFQEARLFRRSVRDNIAYGRPGATDEEVMRVARLAEADEFIRKMPGGYAAIVEEGGDNLSGGERQRINIARALMREAPIVVLDEPATALDARTETRVRAALDRLTGGRTTFVVAHQLGTIARADRILYLEGGRMAGFGTHEELIDTCPGYREIYESQFVTVAAAESGTIRG